MPEFGESAVAPYLPAAVVNDLTAICEAHALTTEGTARLARIVAGAVPGNRDRPLFLLARAICERLPAQTSLEPVFALILPDDPGALPRRLDRALLDFLLSMDGHAAFAEIRETLSGLHWTSPEAPGVLARCLSRCLYRYRSTHLPAARHQAAFGALRRHLHGTRPADPVPRDGDALDFWEVNASRSDWTLYRTAFESLAAYDDALALTASWQPAVSLDTPELAALPQEDARLRISQAEAEPGAALTRAADALEAAPVKLFLGRELDDMRALAGIGHHGLRWPRASMALLALGPCQGSAVQHLRRGTEMVPEAVCNCAAAPDYATLCARYAAIRQQARDALWLGLQQGQTVSSPPEGDETASVASMASAETQRRLRRMLRRKSVAGCPAAELTRWLLMLRPELIAVEDELRRVLRVWSGLGTDRLDDCFSEDRRRFAAVLMALYAETERRCSHAGSR